MPFGVVRPLHLPILPPPQVAGASEDRPSRCARGTPPCVT